MDAVELALPAAVVVSKFMGPEGFGGAEVGAGDGGVGVTAMEVEASESEGIAIVVAPSIEGCSSFLSEKDEVGSISMSKSTVLNRRDIESCGDTSQLSSFHGEDALAEIKRGSKNSAPLSLPILDGKQIQRKKVVRNSVGNSKRSRMSQMDEMPTNEDKADVIKDKTQMGKQKNGLNGKRGDKRNGKVPLKSKSDCFSLKAGMLSFNSAAGGNNFLGIYSWKPYPLDVTKYLDDLSVNKLLDGCYKCPSFAKDKVKKAANSNESILQSVRKACSILQLRKPIQTQNSNGIDNSYYWKVPSCSASSESIVPSGNDSDKRDSCVPDLSSDEKFQDSFPKPKSYSTLLAYAPCQPKDVLERLALPLPKDLDSLLLDVTKPSVNTKSNSDSRDKQISERASLPPFSWSHNYGGHCKSNADTSKICVNRTVCQGRWVKTGKRATSLEGKTGFLDNLESLTYDQSLVPLSDRKCGPSGNEMASSTSVSFAPFGLGSLSSLTSSMSPQFLPPEHSPTLLAAAQTLYDMATVSLRQEAHGMIRLLKKPSEKTMKACKSKSTVKPGDTSVVASKPRVVSADQVKNGNETLPLKKPRLLVNEKSKDPVHNTVRKGSTNWPMPRSGRSSPSKSFRDFIAETKCYNPNLVKQSCMTPPPPRFLDKPHSGRRS